MNEREPDVLWYFVHDGKRDGAGYFVGYALASNRRIGFIGMAGFRPQPVPAAEWIPVRGELISDYSNWSSLPLWVNSGQRWPQPQAGDLAPRLVFVPSGQQLRVVDLASRTVTTAFETTEPIESAGIPMLSSWSGGRAPKEPSILVRTREKIYTLDRDYKLTRVFTIPTESDRHFPAQWYEIGNGEAIVVLVTPQPAGDDPKVTKQIGYRIGANGLIKEQFELALHNGAAQQSQRAQAGFLALVLPAPALTLAADVLLVTATDRMPTSPSDFLRLLETLGPGLLAVLVFASVLAVITWRRCRSFGLPARDQVGWVIFVLLFGLPAYIGLLLYRRWPTRLPCPHCHTPVPRDRMGCAACGMTFPMPARKGIEVFA
jgi:hypothetical protein